MARALADPGLQASIPDLEFAHAVLLVDCDPIDEAPVLDLRIRKGIRRHGVKLAVASARPTALDAQAVSVTRIAPGGAGALLADEAGDLAAWLRDAGEDLVIVYGERALAGDGAKALLNLATRLGLRGRAGAGLIEVPSVPNARGLREAGFAPGHGPGFATLPRPAATRTGSPRAWPPASCRPSGSTTPTRCASSPTARCGRRRSAPPRP